MGPLGDVYSIKHGPPFPHLLPVGNLGQLCFLARSPLMRTYPFCSLVQKRSMRWKTRARKRQEVNKPEAHGQMGCPREKLQHLLHDGVNGATPKELVLDK